MIRAAMLVALTAGMVVLPASHAAATPAETAFEVFADWRTDGDITDCRYTRQELVDTLSVTSGVDLDSYAPGFREEVRREIARHDSGGCSGIVPGTQAPGSGTGQTPARSQSTLRRLSIVRIRPRGGLMESVTIRNSASSGASLKGATLRDRRGRRLKLGSKRLAAGGSLRVYTGCAKGRKKAYRRGSRLYACAKKRVWDDGGDVVKIVDRRGVTVAQRGYGRLRGVFRFP